MAECEAVGHMKRSLYSRAAILYYGLFGVVGLGWLVAATLAAPATAAPLLGWRFLLFLALEMLVGWFYFRLQDVSITTTFETPVLLAAMLTGGPLFAAWIGAVSYMLSSLGRIWRRAREEGIRRPLLYNTVAVPAAGALRAVMWLVAGGIYGRLATQTPGASLTDPQQLGAVFAAFSGAAAVNVVVLGVGEWLHGSSVGAFLRSVRVDLGKELILLPLGVVMAQGLLAFGVFPFLVLALLLALGAWVLQALTQTRSRLERKVEHLSILNEVSIAITSTLDLDELLEVVTAQVGKVMSTDNFFIALYDESRQMLSFEVLIDGGKRFESTEMPLGKSLTGWIVAHKASILLRNSAEARAYDVQPAFVGLARHPESFLGVPIQLGPRVLGVIAVQSYEPGTYDAGHLEVLYIVANAAAVAIENVRLYRELGELNRNLEEKVGERTRELQDANVRIREADRMKSQFLANMSHELRTPLNSIIGFAEVLEEKLATTLTSRHLKFLNNILMSGRHLLRIINDILDLSKIEAGRMEVYPQEFPLREVVEGVTALMKPLCAKKGVTIEMEVPADLPALFADDGKLKQILYNLLTNAVKFSPNGKTVRLSAKHRSEASSPIGVEAIEIAVADRGIGIRKEDQELIFHEFFQSDSGGRARQIEGTGLGLTLTRKFVELHGGRLWLESEPGEGSTFTFALPRRFVPPALREDTVAGVPPARIPAPPAAAAEPARRTRPLILVVEDDEEAWELLSNHLVQAGYRTVKASTGAEAVRLARALKPAAITLDLVLPDGDGWDVLKQLKASEGTNAIPVIIISMIDNRELGFTLGAADYFVKPVGRSELLARLAALHLPAQNANGAAKLLLIDDDPQVAEYLRSFLEPAGYTLLYAADGEQGRALASAERPAAVILDLLMPGVNGFDVALDLKSRPESSDIPIIVYTAKDITDDDRNLLRGRIDAVVSKGDSRCERLIHEIQSAERLRA